MRSRRLVACLAVFAALLLPARAHAITNPQIPGLQVALRAQGFYRGAIDGIAGPLTAQAVRRFQRKAALVVDGVAGPLTRRKLGRLGRPLFGRRHLLLRGSVGWDVSCLEFFLRAKGFDPGKVDGHFAAATARAVRRYQRARRLGVDGIAGPKTLRTFGVRAVSHRPAARVGGRRSTVRASLTFWARHYGIRPSLVKALAWMESGFQPHVRSGAGAWGVMQVTPGTWSYVEMFLIGRRVPRTVDGNVRVGVAYLHQLLHEFNFHPRRALAAYNQGSWSVRTHGVYAETRAFVATVIALQRHFV
jgi:transglycosylase-like protein with SLT domain/putative peptidoglycan binding protein